MSRTHRSPKPARTDWQETTASSAHDWITPTDVVTLALGAFYMATRINAQYWRAGINEPQLSPPYHLRECFQENLTRLFDLRVRNFAKKLGVPKFENDDADHWLERNSESETRSDIETELRPIPLSDANSDIHRAPSQNGTDPSRR